MKRFFALAALLALLLLLAACGVSGGNAGPSAAGDSEVIVITEKMFVAQTNEIYANAGDYVGRTIRYEGLFKSTEYNGRDYLYVLRYGPGCCGYDGEVGFEVEWAGELPERDDWVEATGVLDTYELDGYTYMIVRLESLTVLDERGAETVTQ